MSLPLLYKKTGRVLKRTYVPLGEKDGLVGLFNRLKTVSHASHCADHFLCCAQFYLISILESPCIPCYIERSLESLV